MFDDKVYTERRSALTVLMHAAGAANDLVLLLGHDDSPYNFAANPYPFRQDANALYYLGLSQPGVAAVLDMATGRTTLAWEEQSVESLVWCTLPTPEAMRAQCGADAVVSRAALIRTVADAMQAGRRVHALPSARGPAQVRLHEWLGATSVSGIASNAASAALIRCVVQQREVKSPAELAQIEAALGISARMHHLALAMAAPGVSEQVIVNEMQAEVARAGSRMAYPPICTVEGQVLHHLSHGNTLAAGDLLLIDAGAESPMGYASDITRTHCVGDVWRDEQALMRDAAQRAQNAAAALARPGVPMAEVHLAAARALLEGVAPLKLFRGSIDAVLDSAAYGLIFPHGVGHLLGLDVHDMESLGEDAVGYDEQHRRATAFGPKHLRLGKRLREGMTITLEPGLYFIPRLWQQWQATGLHAGLLNAASIEQAMGLGGLRTEDNFVVRADGARRLGPPIH